MTTLLLDMDVVAYRAAFAAEKTKFVHIVDDKLVYFDDAKTAKEAAAVGGHVWSRKDVQPEDQAILIADCIVRDIRDHYQAENPTVVGYLSGIGNYRHSIATRANYKSGRGMPPVHLKAVRNHLIVKGAIVSAGEEADDMLAIALTADKTAVLVSIDKDLLQVPGRHYNFVTKEEVTVSAKEAVINFYSQVLSGDSVDNVPGLPGVGPVRARRALADCRSPLDCWSTAVGLYTAEFGSVRGPEYALEAARLVYVRRYVNETWQPPAKAVKDKAA